VDVPDGNCCTRPCPEASHLGAGMIVISTEARTLRKVAVGRSEGSEQRKARR
jgi:hypothetical protein